MRRHFSHQSLQRQGCLTLRNIAARVPEVRAILLDAGAEDVLRVRQLLLYLYRSYSQQSYTRSEKNFKFVFYVVVLIIKVAPVRYRIFYYL
jgi:hypothetical protein